MGRARQARGLRNLAAQDLSHVLGTHAVQMKMKLAR
jgi:hypothetical protein